jgi:hypothetical protein
MVQRFREDVTAAARLRFHLAEIKKLMARDTANESRDLLKDASLLVWDEDQEDDGDDNTNNTDDEREVQVKGDRTIGVSNFLRSQLPKYSRHVINRIVNKLRSPYARKLSAAKHAELRSHNKHPVAHINVNKPSITYFACDLPLMGRILTEIEDSVKACIHKVLMEARETLMELGPDAGMVF